MIELDILKKAYSYVKQNGYTTGVTGREFFNLLNNPDSNYQWNNLPSDQEIDEVETWLNICPDTDWGRSVKAVWLSERLPDVRSASLLCSLFNVYFRKQREESQRKANRDNPANQYAGNVGDKINIKIASFEVVTHREWGGYYGPISSYPVYEIKDKEGKTYRWGCSNGTELHVNDTLTGRITRTYENRDGIKITEISRCKITDLGQIPSIFSFRETLNEEVLEETYEKTYADMKYLSHFMKHIDGEHGLEMDLVLGRISVSPKYNSVCLGNGYSKSTGLPTQISRMSTSDSNKWLFGINFYADKLFARNSEDFEVVDYNDAQDSLSSGITTNGLYVQYLFRASDGNCFLKISQRQAPLKISRDLYDLLMKQIFRQSDDFMRLHTDDRKSMTMNCLEKDVSFPYLKQRFEANKNLRIVDGIYFSTKKGNKGVLLTSKGDWERNPRTSASYNQFTDKIVRNRKEGTLSVESYHDICQRYEDQLDSSEKALEEIRSSAKEYLDFIEKNNLHNADQVRLDPVTNEWTSIPKGSQPIRGTRPVSGVKNMFKTKEKDCLNEIESITKEYDKFKRDWDGYNLVTTKNDPTGKEQAGGMPAYLCDQKMIDEIIHSPSLDEFEIRYIPKTSSDYCIRFKPEDIDTIYLPSEIRGRDLGTVLKRPKLKDEKERKKFLQSPDSNKLLDLNSIDRIWSKDTPIGQDELNYYYSYSRIIDYCRHNNIPITYVGPDQKIVNI